MLQPPIITLTSDFGLKDHYVGVMKAVVLGIAPTARLVDVSHEIAPQDIMAAAWVTKNAAFIFPKGTVHLCVVDPGVGTTRRPIAVSLNGHFFVGPDNGLFSLVAEGLSYEAYELTNTSFWRDTRSNTFHGRDIFAPVAAHLARGVPIEEMGVRIDSMTYFRWATPVADKDGIQGWVVHIDAFGNLITNISKELVKEVAGDGPMKIYVGSTILRDISPTFASVPEGDPVAFIGSSGYLEIGLNRGNAERMLNIPKGAPVSMIFNRS
jgi:S-adenosylmethionine hydrolase